jgi:hypothetical protein
VHPLAVVAEVVAGRVVAAGVGEVVVVVAPVRLRRDLRVPQPS